LIAFAIKSAGAAVAEKIKADFCFLEIYVASTSAPSRPQSPLPSASPQMVRKVLPDGFHHLL